MEQQGFKTLIEAGDIQRRVREMAEDISIDYPKSSPLFIVLLKGAFIFAADLIRNLDIQHEIDFITLFSYQNGTKRFSKCGCDSNGYRKPRATVRRLVRQTV